MYLVIGFCDQAAQDDKLIGITPAMREGSGLVKFSQQYADRYYDVGIAEQHALTFAAGLACEGLKPVVAIYSTFLQRAYDQLIHDIAIQDLDVTFAIDRAGLVGADGATHAGAFDYSFLRCIPNMVVMAPKDEAECRDMLHTAYQHNGPATVRYPRGGGPDSEENTEMTLLPIGESELLRESTSKATDKRIALLAWGSMVATAQAVADDINATLVNMRFVKPLDQTMIKQISETHSHIVTLEEQAIMGGAGSAVNEILLAQGIVIPTLNLGLPDEFIEQGSQAQLHANIGLDQKGITESISQFI